MRNCYFKVLLALALLSPTLAKTQIPPPSPVPEMAPAPAKGLPDCRGIPPFTKGIGFDLRYSAFTTVDRLHTGLVYAELIPPNTHQLGPEPGKPKIYQPPSWTGGGSLGPFVIDKTGALYVVPLPMINVLRNDPAKQNMIYRVSPDTGEMTPYLILPTIHSPLPENPFGILGMGYDCETGVIYASSVQGSDRLHEVGRIYAIKTGPSPAVLDMIESIDGFGLGIGVVGGEKRLFFGKARTPDIFSVPIGADGRFAGKPEFALSLDGLGIRGDDHARKIRFAENGELTVHGVEFYFNLTAPTEVQQTVYVFTFDPLQKKWLPVSQGK